MFTATKRIRGVALMLVLFLAVPLAHANNVFAFSSASGDYIGLGQTVAFNTSNATFSLSGDGTRASLSVRANSGSWWDIEISAPAGARFAPGRYVDAERSAFKTGRSVGLDVSGDGRGCNEIWGEVGIRSVGYDAQGHIKWLDASFIQRCEDGSAPPLAGEIRYGVAQYWVALDSAAGDYIGQGTQKRYFNDTSILALSGTTSYLQLGVSGQRDDWLAILVPPTGKHLQVGTYDTSRSADATHAGLDFFGDGRGCNSSTGTLKITRIVTNSTGKVLKLAADLEQHCEGSAEALKATVHYGT